MRQTPDLPLSSISTHLEETYAIPHAQIEFLPLGADVNTMVYRVLPNQAAPLFLKIRKSNFAEASVLVPQYLHDQGVAQIIAPRKTIFGSLWGKLGEYTTIVYPYIEGRNGFEVPLHDDQWVTFGSALKQIHKSSLPPSIAEKIPIETYSAHWREKVKDFQIQSSARTYHAPDEARLAELLRKHQEEIRQIIGRAERLAHQLQLQTPENVLCHSDLHAGNLLITDDRTFFIVDWDEPILAPRERDLMFIGGGVGPAWNNPREVDLFYQGYGETNIHRTALAYYRYERIIQDISADCENILDSSEGAENRQQSLQYFASQFDSDGVLPIAHHTYQQWKGTHP